MNYQSIKSAYNNLGPGLLFAAQSVGTSHLVQSTRAGGEYGFSLIPLVLIACIIKYPAFRFGIDYANATKTSLLENYMRQGRMVIIFFIITLSVDMFVATAAVTLVSAGLLSAIFNISVNIQYLTMLILIAFALLLIIGKYQLFESITKLFVLSFCVLALVATFMAMLQLADIKVDMLPPVVFDNATILFMIAIAGWMPTSVSASVYLSEWRAKKSQLTTSENDSKYSGIDFDVGYWGTVFLALCFVGLGAVLIYPTGVSTEQTAIGFAKLLFTLFTGALGEWTLPIIAVAAIALMFSTSLSLLDACPRAGSRILANLTNAKDSYIVLIITQVVGASIILLFFFSSFTSLIDMATSLAFITAPFIAFLNHRAMFYADVPEKLQPSIFIRRWSIFGIVSLTVFALVFVYVRFLN